LEKDASLAATGNDAENLAILKRLAGKMIRIALGGIRGTAKGRRQATWDVSWTIRLWSSIFEVKPQSIFNEKALIGMWISS